MSRLFRALRTFLQREDGPTSVEYAVLLALIIVVCLSAISTIGSRANQTFLQVGSSLGTSTGGGG